MPKRLTLEDRLLEKVELRPDGCWAWLASRTDDGYGRIWLDGKQRRAHRVAFELWVGPIPDGREIDHLCRVRECVNPDHLEPVTPWENLRRSPVQFAAVNARKTVCVNGHPLTEDNVTRWPSRPNVRQCRACRALYRRPKSQRTKP